MKIFELIKKAKAQRLTYVLVSVEDLPKEEVKLLFQMEEVGFIRFEIIEVASKKCYLIDNFK